MAEYAITFDMDTRAMASDGVTDSERTTIYQREIPDALAACGFTKHPQGSMYHTEDNEDGLSTVMTLGPRLQQMAPNFCKYARNIHVFRMEEWSDVTDVICGASATPRLKAVK